MVTKVPTLDKPQIIIHAEKSLNYTPFDVKWVPCSARFVVVGQKPRGTGSIEVYEIEPGDIKKISEVEKPGAFKCSTFNAGSLATRHMATGDFDGRVCTWDLERLDAPMYVAKGHSQIINAIDGCGGLGIGGGAPEIATGSRDGCVKVWDTRQKDRPVASIEPSSTEGVRDCWSVSFGNSYNDSERCVAASYDNGDIKIFDLRTMSLLHEWTIPNAACAIEFDRRDIKMNKLVAGTLEGTINVWDMRTKHPKKGYASLLEKTHDQTTVWSVKHMPQNRDIFSVATGDGSIALYKYNYPLQRSVKDAEDGEMMGTMGSLTLLNRAIVGQQPVCAMDWSPDKAGLTVCVGFDQAVRVVIATRVGTATA